MKITFTKFYSRMPYLSTTSPKVRGNANAHPFATSRKDSARSSRIIFPANFSHQLSRPSWATPSSISVILFPRPRSHSHRLAHPPSPPSIHPRCSRWSRVIKCPNCLIRTVYGSYPFPFFSYPPQPSRWWRVLNVLENENSCRCLRLDRRELTNARSRNARASTSFGFFGMFSLFLRVIAFLNVQTVGSP